MANVPNSRRFNNQPSRLREPPVRVAMGTRAMVDVKHGIRPGNVVGATVTVLQLRLLSQARAAADKDEVFSYLLPTQLRWAVRRQTMLRQITEQDADIVCLQDVDRFEHFWQPQLSAAGYDVLFKARTCRTGRRHTGVALGFKRNLFQLFCTLPVELNEVAETIADPNLAARALQDNVGLIVGLQPFEASDSPSALCVACVELLDDHTMPDVRQLQARHFVRLIERFNADFHVPVLLAGNLNSLPASDIHHILCTGRMPWRPLPPSEPREAPEASEPSLSSITLRWFPPAHNNSPIGSYIVERRVGGNTALGWTAPVEVDVLDCLDYDDVRRCAGERDNCRTVITGLSSGVSYEFRVAAVNGVGQGPFSKPSRPLATARVAKNRRAREALAPRDPPPLPVARSSGDGYTGLTPRYLSGEVNEAVTPTRFVVRAEEEPYRVPEPLEPPRYMPVRDGCRNDKLLHTLKLDSAYRTACPLGEPLFTSTTERWTGTDDYILYSSETLIPSQLLSVPELDDLAELDHRNAELLDDPDMPPPPDWDARSFVTLEGKNGRSVAQVNDAYCGEWVPPALENPRKAHHWLPNEQYGSNHIPLVCRFAFAGEALAARWH